VTTDWRENIKRAVDLHIAAQRTQDADEQRRRLVTAGGELSHLVTWLKRQTRELEAGQRQLLDGPGKHDPVWIARVKVWLRHAAELYARRGPMPRFLRALRHDTAWWEGRSLELLQGQAPPPAPPDEPIAPARPAASRPAAPAARVERPAAVETRIPVQFPAPAPVSAPAPAPAPTPAPVPAPAKPEPPRPAAAEPKPAAAVEPKPEKATRPEPDPAESKPAKAKARAEGDKGAKGDKGKKKAKK
jgi:hypothetical protein